jgi:hypothetical protein
VAVLESALVLALTEGRPNHEKGLVVKLRVLEGCDDAFEVEKQHKALELEVDSRSVEFTGNVCVHGVKLLVVAAKLFIEDMPDKQLVHVVFVNVLLKLAVGTGVSGIIKH